MSTVREKTHRLHIGFVIYDGMTALDFIGAYDPLTRLHTMRLLPGVEWNVCATTDTVRDGAGLRFVPDTVGQPLTGYDLVYVPGGFSTRDLVSDAAFVEWIKTAAETPLLISVCTGSLLLGAAGLLKDVRATTHPTAYEDLRPFCREVMNERIVDEGRVITGRGVTSAIDLGLYLVEKLAGRQIRQRIQVQMDYPYGIE
jgi:transcriptional regulator GlxA family with amidase domain